MGLYHIWPSANKKGAVKRVSYHFYYFAIKKGMVNEGRNTFESFPAKGYGNGRSYHSYAFSIKNMVSGGSYHL